MTSLAESFCFVGALCGALALFFTIAAAITDVLWPRLAMRHRRQPAQARYVRGRSRS